LWSARACYVGLEQDVFERRVDVVLKKAGALEIFLDRQGGDWRG
jgi:hypothetical protein